MNYLELFLRSYLHLCLWANRYDGWRGIWDCRQVPCKSWFEYSWDGMMFCNLISLCLWAGDVGVKAWQPWAQFSIGWDPSLLKELSWALTRALRITHAASVLEKFLVLWRRWTHVRETWCNVTIAMIETYTGNYGHNGTWAVWQGLGSLPRKMTPNWI